MEDKAILRKNKDMVHRVIGGDTILLPVYKRSEEINCIYMLNPSAAWVWDMIDNKTTLSGIKKKAFDKFPTGRDVIARKMDTLVEELKQINAVV
jgi:hypothetical protein